MIWGENFLLENSIIVYFAVRHRYSAFLCRFYSGGRLIEPDAVVISELPVRQ